MDKCVLLRKKFETIVFILTVLVKNVLNANILAILPTAVPSHRNALKAVLKPLASEHQITYYGPKMHMQHINITEKDIVIDNILNLYSEGIFTASCEKSSIDFVLNGVLWLNYTFFNNMFTGKDVQDLLRTKQQFDLMLTIAHSSEHFYQFAHLFKIPMIHLATSIPFPWTNEAMDNPNFYSTDISMVTSESSNSIMDRLNRFTKICLISTHYKWRYMPLLNQVTRQYFPPGTPSIEEVAKQTSLLLVNSQSRMGYARPNVPAIVEIGGLHCSTAKPLPADMEDFMESSGKFGVIYFSLGSTIRGSLLPEKIRKAILNVFRKLPQKVLWKWEGNMTDLPPNVMISKWVPQQDVLGHSKLRLFITQGGMLSVQEAAFHGVPLLLIPLILDQYSNAIVAEQNGYGLKMDFCRFSEDDFFESIHKILQNPKFAQKAKEISFAIRDREWSPAEKVKWWIGYVLRHKGTTRIRPTNSVSWIQYSELDICFVLLCIFIIGIYFTYIYPFSETNFKIFD